MSKAKNKIIKIGIVGCGAIGEGVSRFIDQELSKFAQVAAICDINKLKAQKLQKKLPFNPKICDIDALMKSVDLVIEAASVDVAKLILKKIFHYRKELIILSVGALIGDSSIYEKLKKKNIKLHIPSGAICGIDGLGALNLGGIKKISLITSKPPMGLIGANYLLKKKINLSNLKGEKIIFKGKVAEAIKCFPKNINVSATLLLASSMGNVDVCIKADSNLKRNVHRIVVDAKEAKLNISVENIPSKLNPKTSALAILSSQYLLKKIFSPLKIGS